MAKSSVCNMMSWLCNADAVCFNKYAEHTRLELCVHRWPQCSLCHRLLLPPQPPSLYVTVSLLLLQSVIFLQDSVQLFR